MKEKAQYKSPIGVIEIEAENEAIVSLRFVEPESESPNSELQQNVIVQVIKQLEEYFDGNRKAFDVVINASGTPFQQKIWHQLREIPFGETMNYSEIAGQAGIPKAARAVGNANGKNPVCIIVPCHRVIKKSGDSGGYAYGENRKKFLLDLEQRMK